MYATYIPFRPAPGPDNTASATVGTASSVVNIVRPPQEGTFQLLLTAPPANTGLVFVMPFRPPVPPATAPAATALVPGASPGSVPILPGSAQTITVDPETTQLAVIASAAGQTLYVTTGQGL